MFYQAVFEGGILGVAIWIALFCVSTAALAFVLKLFIMLMNKNFINKRIHLLLEGGEIELDEKEAKTEISESENEAESNGEVTILQILKSIPENSMILADRIYRMLSEHHNESRKELEERASEIAQKDSRRILRVISALQMCANIAPMLGLLGTVQGMVAAFMGLGTALGPEKSAVLAVSIAQALYTTAGGLVIAIPATVMCIFFRNRLEKRLEDVSDDVEDVIAQFNGGN